MTKVHAYFFITIQIAEDQISKIMGISSAKKRKKKTVKMFIVPTLTIKSNSSIILVDIKVNFVKSIINQKKFKIILMIKSL